MGGKVVRNSVQNFSYLSSATVASYSAPCLGIKLLQKPARRAWSERSKNGSGASAPISSARWIRGRCSRLKEAGRKGMLSICLESRLQIICQKGAATIAITALITYLSHM